MIETHETTRFVKGHVIDTAAKLLKAAGCEVTRSDVDESKVTLDIFLPPDSEDPHGDRMLAALAERG